MSFRSFRHLRYPSRLIKALTNCSLRKSLAVVVLISTLAQGTLASEIVRVDTDTGSFVLEMYADIAPVTVANFLSYVNSGAYENTIIHRKVTNFVIQGGGFLYNPELGDISSINVGPAIVNEFNRSNTRGTIAMAKFPISPIAQQAKMVYQSSRQQLPTSTLKTRGLRYSARYWAEA